MTGIGFRGETLIEGQLLYAIAGVVSVTIPAHGSCHTKPNGRRKKRQPRRVQFLSLLIDTAEMMRRVHGGGSDAASQGN